MSACKLFTLRCMGPHSLVDRRVDSQSIRFLTAVVPGLLGSHVRKPSSAYGWSGDFSPGSSVDERLARYKWNILERAVKPRLKKKMTLRCTAYITIYSYRNACKLFTPICTYDTITLVNQKALVVAETLRSRLFNALVGKKWRKR